jgi:hypothetical protein
VGRAARNGTALTPSVVDGFAGGGGRANLNPRCARCRPSPVSIPAARGSIDRHYSRVLVVVTRERGGRRASTHAPAPIEGIDRDTVVSTRGRFDRSLRHDTHRGVFA